MSTLPELKYSPTHTWARVDGEYAYIGVTDFAQDQLGEVLYVDVPEVEDELTKDSDFGVIESSKVAPKSTSLVNSSSTSGTSTYRTSPSWS